jgi:hypothetical protein
MAYATLEDLVDYLTQFRDLEPDDPSMDTLDRCVTRAEGFVNGYLGLSSSLTLAASTTRTLYGDGGLYLTSDIPMSTVTTVTAPTGYTVPSYVLMDGVLRITDSGGVLVQPWYPALGGTSWPYTSGWAQGVPYSVTATFGVSSGDMATLTEATLQTAVQLWRYKDSGGSETIGAEGGVVTVRAGWTPLVRDGLEAIKRRINGNSVGVY